MEHNKDLLRSKERYLPSLSDTDSDIPNTSYKFVVLKYF